MAFAGGHGRAWSVFWAVNATASARCCTPVITHGPKPVIVLPGLMATSALIKPPVMHVTAWPAMIPLRAAAPKLLRDPEVTTTVEKPEMVPLSAFTALV